MSQIAEEIEADRIKETANYLKTAAGHFSEERKSLNDIENKEKINLFIEASGANEDIIVEDMTMKQILKIGSSTTSLLIKM